MEPSDFALSVVVPVRNEEDALPLFLASVLPVLRDLTPSFEIIFVDDGSTDGTARVIEAARATEPRLRLLSLSRNFGKEAALTAGLHFATGDAAIPMDVDLQDPPEVIPRLVEKWLAGCDIVYARRRSRPSDTMLKRVSAGHFYTLFNRLSDIPIPSNVGDFRLMDRRVLDALQQFPERNRFMKGLFAALGFHQDEVLYDRPERAAGQTKFRFWRLWNFALDGITSFSSMPIRVWSYIGAAVALLGFLYGGFIVVHTLVYGRDTPGFATLAVLVTVLGGLQLLSIGIIGEYASRIFVETKNRPLYIVRDLAGFDGALIEERRAELSRLAVLPRRPSRRAGNAGKDC
ncbi:glycosyltransferase family 2 protein [Zavarzinia aquatilis]|uniref:Glycosyltransferase n=1 Tax=Zavarzinia aquatilis TaxID=2211142 RepID=A0A317EEH5_9PROT|nr:glycosyltransferase family 2 protein [Zavarzinia aquatilis]PWR25022.1 glycosyltransferase [Zavarzinia aquatilis]